MTPRTGAAYRIQGDLVVDACGRASRSPVWLTELGYPAPPEQRVPVDVTYVTQTYQRDSRHLGGLLGALTNAVPGRPAPASSPCRRTAASLWRSVECSVSSLRWIARASRGSPSRWACR
ncbi:hypothetical protein NKG94_27250 [Micromonospora sp. M12]